MDSLLDNYEFDKYGILHQIDIDKSLVNIDYGQQRNDYGELSNYLSYLRMGYIIGVLGLQDINSLLDIGFGNGDFLRVASKVVSRTYGYDLDYKYLPDCSTIGSLDDYYNIITMFDSFEHFDDLDIVFDFKCDYLVISVPNCKNKYDNEWLSEWKHLRPNEHLHHFDLSSLIFFLSKQYTYINSSFVEDIIRVGKEPGNILTACFRRKK